MEEKIRSLGERAHAELGAAVDAGALEAWRVEHLGRKGALAALMTQLGAVPKEDRPRLGALANEVKTGLQAAFDRRLAALEAERRRAAEAAERVDVTLPGAPPNPGRLHLTTQTLRRICTIFHGMGFEIFESPEVESDQYNFELLNMPQHHPARDMWDTFYVNETTLLRTHTSPGQIRAMKGRAPEPIRVVLPGRVYRYEAVSARSEFMFYQVEGIAVGRDVTMAQLKGLLDELREPDVRREAAPAPARQLLPVHRAERRGRHGLHPLRRQGLPDLQGQPAGSRSPAPAWSTRPCSRTAATTRRSSPASRSGWVPSASRC